MSIGAAGVSFAFATQELLCLVAACLLGIGMAGVWVVNATLVVGAGFDDESQATKLSLLQLSLPAGQVLGLATMSARAAAGVGLLLLPSDSGTAALVVFGVVMVVYPLFELNAAILAAVTSPIGPGGGQGGVGAAMALGTIVASVLAGWVADQIGFPSLATITLIAAGGATIIGVIALRRPTDAAPT